MAVRGALISAAAASLLVNLLMLVGPLFMLQTYDRVLPSRSISTLVGLLLIVLVLLMVQAAVDVLRSRLLSRMGEAFDEAIREKVFDGVHHAALTAAEPDGLQIMRDLDTIRGFISGTGLVARLRSALDAALHPRLHAVSSPDGPGRDRRRHCARPDHDCRRNIHPCADAGAGRTRLVAPADGGDRLPSCRRRSCARHEAADGRPVVAAHASLSRCPALTSDLTGGFGSASRFLRMILQSGVLALGAYLVINQQATAGVMLAATILSIRALAPIELAIANWRGFISCRASFQRLRETFAAMPASRSSTAVAGAEHRFARDFHKPYRAASPTLSCCTM